MNPTEKFYQSVKSTIDYLGHQVAEEVKQKIPQLTDLQAFTLDATTGVVEAMTSSDPAIVWSLNAMTPDPRDPLYKITFLIGPKTSSDVSGELMAVLMGAVQSYFPNKSSFDVKNYSGPVISEGPGETGVGFVLGTTIEEQVYDNQASVRMAFISVALSRDL